MSTDICTSSVGEDFCEERVGMEIISVGMGGDWDKLMSPCSSIAVCLNTADHLNTTADRLCLICLHTADERCGLDALGLAVLCSGNALVLINAVALHRARLVLGWVTAFGQVNCLIT